MATRSVPTKHGIAFFLDEHPNIWDRNLIAVDTPLATFAELSGEAEEVQRELPHRMFVVDGAGAPLRAGARAAGWSVERSIAMVALRAPDGPEVRYPVRGAGGD